MKIQASQRIPRDHKIHLSEEYYEKLIEQLKRKLSYKIADELNKNNLFDIELHEGGYDYDTEMILKAFFLKEESLKEAVTLLKWIKSLSFVTPDIRMQIERVINNLID